MDLNDPVQRDLQKKAKDETVHLLDSLFRSQIAYFTEVKSHLSPQTKRFRDITLYLSRLNQAVVQQDVETKEKIWFDVFEEVCDHKSMKYLLKFNHLQLIISSRNLHCC